MRTRLCISVLAAWPLAAAGVSYHVAGGGESGAWSRILEPLGLAAAGPDAAVAVIPRGTRLDAAAVEAWLARAGAGAVVIAEGESPLSEALGIAPTSERLAVRSVEDLRAPRLEIVWEKKLDLPVFRLPREARVFARERWQKAPLVAGIPRGKGAVLWLACSPGVEGYERFPYLPQAMADLGVSPAVTSSRLWAFFDSSYRLRADPEYLAKRWRASGIAGLHIAAWHYWEPDPERDAYLKKVIEACHRNAILAYAWLELPHVSEKFWQDHPEWREKTAIGQDAHLDWRKLMNLANRGAFQAVSAGAARLLERFDWDGVNLAELYFESLEGAANPARFTPLNEDVRREFEKRGGVDPLSLFAAKQTNPAALAKFLDFRAELAQRLQEEWIGVIDGYRRRSKPHLDLVLTHVDDRFDARMRDAIGADASRALPLMERHDFTFLIEDPATIWNLGPRRYPQIAGKYAPLTRARNKLAIDINIVERYQDVYPTKQQTGVELMQLVREASRAFERVALYFENSLLTQDLPLLGPAAADVRVLTPTPTGFRVSSPHGFGLRWQGGALVDGRPWALRGGGTIWLPAGEHTVDRLGAETPDSGLRILDFNGGVTTAAVLGDGVELAYRSAHRVFARLERPAKTVEIDGESSTPQYAAGSLVLPKGQHIVVIR